jgi:glycosyltransferase involved in cell wall biosynthesis
LPRGGRERQQATIYKFSDKNRIIHKVVCFNRTKTSYIEEYGMSDDVIFLPSKNLLKRLKVIRRVIRENNIDLIWSWGGLEASYGILISLTSGVKHINGSIRHGIVRFSGHQLWRMLILHLSKTIVANSFAGLKANKLRRGFVLYNGIDNRFYINSETKTSEIRKEFGIASDKIVLLSVANLVPYKDFDTVLTALSNIKAKGISFHYLAIGEGKERKRIEELVKKMDLTSEVSFPGNRMDIKDILYAADIFIHSSLGEGCSNAILEAMAAGLPVIATDTGGTNEVVDDSNGRLFEFGNVEQLEKYLLEILSDKSLRKTLAENSKKKAISNFSIDRMISEFYKIIEKARE